MTVEPTIAFDESGNTGANLLDKTQPFFVLASVHYSQEEADCMLSHILTNNVAEAKFSKLKKTSSGQNKILSFLSQPEISKEKIKISFVYKRFMVIVKIIDILVETVFNFHGINLYKDGTHRVMSNLYYWTMPAFCGNQRFEILLEQFISMIRKQDRRSIEEFYQAAQNAWDSCEDDEDKELFSPILVSQNYIDEILNGVNYLTLDPAIQAFFEHCGRWGEKFNSSFNTVHDESKSIFAKQQLLESLMKPNNHHSSIGYDTRKFLFPLKSKGINFDDSKNDKRLQLADIIASTTNFWLKGKLSTPKAQEQEFWDAIDKLDISKFIISGIAPIPPDPELTIQALGINSNDSDIDAVDFITDFLERENK